MSGRDDLVGSDESGGSRFHFLQPNRDLQSNWEVDLAKKLEEYLLKICSGEISSDQDHEVNPGSIQVYSRKVEYLHSLVLHALEFLSQKSDKTRTARYIPVRQLTGMRTGRYRAYR
ncbi:hypothetical protein BHM03_00008827 [Ensete ventricosum]|nr:hypothetical protein BHM03_00008827 [Ensete ventricosum]